MMKKMLFSVAFATLALGACSSDKQTRVASLETPAAPSNVPTIFIAAPSPKVEQVIISRAAARGSVIKNSGNGRLVLERPLPAATPEIVAACGENPSPRRVRVVMSLKPAPNGTQLTERRFIVDNAMSGDTCPLPLSTQDYAQSISAMSAVKQQAEAQ